MSVGHENKKAVEKSVLNYFNSQSIWQSCRRSQIPDEPCMTGVRCSRNHPPRIDGNNRNCSENSARPDSTKFSHAANYASASSGAAQRMRHDKTSHTISWISSSVRVAPTFLKSSAASIHVVTHSEGLVVENLNAQQ